MAGTAGVTELFSLVCAQTAPGADLITYTMLRGAVAEDASTAATAVNAASRVVLGRQALGAGVFVDVTTIMQPVANTVVRTTALIAAQKVFGATDVAQFEHTHADTHTRTVVYMTAPAVPPTI